MNILDDIGKLVEAIRSLDRAEMEDELLKLVEKLRSMDRSELLEELFGVAERVRELLLENQALKRRLKARLQPAKEELSYPYEGIYWFDANSG
ncbi:MAG: hypothetical protein ACE5HP_05825 [Gemmatimonadota bacterium]